MASRSSTPEGIHHLNTLHRRRPLRRPATLHSKAISNQQVLLQGKDLTHSNSSLQLRATLPLACHRRRASALLRSNTRHINHSNRRGSLEVIPDDSTDRFARGGDWWKRNSLIHDAGEAFTTFSWGNRWIKSGPHTQQVGYGLRQ